MQHHAASWKIIENQSSQNNISQTRLLFLAEPLFLFKAEPLLLATSDFKSTV
jgi:hypothetical protein